MLFVPLIVRLGGPFPRGKGIPSGKARKRTDPANYQERPLTHLHSLFVLYCRLKLAEDLEAENRALRDRMALLQTESDTKGDLIAALESELSLVEYRDVPRAPAVATPRTCTTLRGHERTSSWGSDLVSIESLQANAALVALRLEKEAMEERWESGVGKGGGAGADKAPLPPRPVSRKG